MRRLSGMDAFMLYSEVLPTVPFHTLKIVVLGRNDAGGSLVAQDFRAFLAQEVLDRVPPFRWRLHDSRDLHHPLWLEHQAVDLDRHFFRHVLKGDRDDEETFAVIAEITSTALMRDVPLWEVHVIEGRSDGSTVVVGKVHHALADGAAAAVLLRKALHPTDEEKAARRSGCGMIPDEAPLRGERARLSLQDHRSQFGTIPGLLKRTAQGVTRVSRAHLGGSEPGLFRVPTNSLTGAVSAERSFAVLTLDMGRVIEVKRQLGITVNDVLLGVVAGAVRSVLAARGDATDQPLLVSIPTNSDPDPSRDTGNAVAGIFVELPVNVADPVARARRAATAAAREKERQRLLGKTMIPDWCRFLPPRLTHRALALTTSRRMADRHPMFNIVVSNVPGPREQMSANGHPMVALWSAGPVFEGAGINLTAWSYQTDLAITVHACRRMVPDPSEITTALTSAFDELCAAALQESLQP